MRKCLIQREVIIATLISASLSSGLGGLPVSDASDVLTYMQPDLTLLLTAFQKSHSNCDASTATEFPGLISEEKRLRYFFRRVQPAQFVGFQNFRPLVEHLIEFG